MSQQMMSTPTLNTMGEALALLEKVGFKNILKPAVVSARKMTGDRFKQALIDLVTKEQGRDENLRYLASCLCLSTNQAIKFLTNHNIQFNHDLLVKLGIEQGNEIRNLMKQFDTTGDVNFLNEIRNRFDGVHPQPTQQHDRQSNLAPKSNNMPSNEQYDVNDSYTGNENTEPKTQQNGEKYRSLHFFGKDTALCFNDSRSKSGNIPTINIDAAKVAPGGNRNFDWKNAVHFQFTRNELIGVLSVLTHMRNKVEYKSHGQKNDKGFSIEKQEGKFYLNLFSKEGGARGVPITLEDAVQLALMLIDRLGESFPSYEKPEFLTVMRLVIK
jgi:hypothetical protein